MVLGCVKSILELRLGAPTHAIQKDSSVPHYKSHNVVTVDHVVTPMVVDDVLEHRSSA